MGASSRKRSILLRMFVVPALALLAALSLASCGGDKEATATPTRPTAVPAPPARAADASSPRPRGPVRLRLPPEGYPVLYVRPGRRVALLTGPGGRLVRTVGPRTSFGSPTTFSVVRATRHWAGVTAPYLANDELAWVRLDRRRLAATATRIAIAIDLSSRLAELVRGHHVVRRFAVTVGAPGSPTPTGRFAVTDTLRGHGLNPAYGCCALALSARQSSLPSGWLGGSRIAIHGTYGGVGYAVSHGCIRAANTDVAALVRRAPVGTPVVIQR